MADALSNKVTMRPYLLRVGNDLSYFSQRVLTLERWREGAVSSAFIIASCQFCQCFVSVRLDQTSSLG